MDTAQEIQEVPVVEPDVADVLIPETQPPVLPATPAAPVALQERIQTIDILRGVAFFGVLLINYVFFYQPSNLYATGFRWDGFANQTIEIIDQFFFMGKFYTIFSFLFGLGFSLMLVRAESRGVNLVPVYRRRLFVLLLIGIIHGTLIWHGDILTTYAIFGFVLMLFRKRKTKTIFIWIGILITLNLLLPFIRYTAFQFRSRDPKAVEKMVEDRAKEKKEAVESVKEDQRIYSKGTYAQITEKRTSEYLKAQAFSLIFGGQFLFLFLLGLYAGRRGIFQNVAEHAPFLKKVLMWGLIIGVPGNILVVSVMRMAEPEIPTLIQSIAWAVYVFCVPALSFVYIAGLALLLNREDWRKRLAPLGFVGRMALTNYLLHSIIGSFLFYSYGAGLYMKFGPAVLSAICVVLYLILMAFSKWWLSRFQYGPAEWLWRLLTYGKKPAFRLGT